MTAITTLAHLGDKPGPPPKIPYGNLRLPDGRRVDDVKPGELATVLIAAGVPGVSHEHGKSVNAERYAEFSAALRKEAGDKAEAAWLELHRPKAAPGDGNADLHGV